MKPGETTWNEMKPGETTWNQAETRWNQLYNEIALRHGFNDTLFQKRFLSFFVRIGSLTSNIRSKWENETIVVLCSQNLRQSNVSKLLSVSLTLIWVGFLGSRFEVGGG